MNKSFLPKKHKKLVEDIFGHLSILLTKHGACYPTYFIIKDDKLNPVFINYEKNKDNSITFDVKNSGKIIIKLAEEVNAEAILFASQHFIMEIKKENSLILESVLSRKIEPEDIPGSKQHLTITYINYSGDQTSLIGEILKDPKGTLYTLTEKWNENPKLPWLTSWKYEKEKGIENAAKI